MKWLARASREAVRLVQRLVPRDSRGVTILTYHLVGAGTKSPVDVPADMFRAQLCELKEFAHIMSLGEALHMLELGADNKRPAVVITFDDGFDNFRTDAWPLLERFAIPATFYVPVGFIDGTSRIPLRGIPDLKPMEWGALRELASDSLITIGSHSWQHTDLRRLDDIALEKDLRHSRQRLEERLDKPVRHFCYPQAKWSHRVEKKVREVYRTAVVAGGRRNLAGHFNRMRLGRVPVRTDMPTRLAPVVESAVWLEEWAASQARALR